jgi:hypothetical protein
MSEVSLVFAASDENTVRINGERLLVAYVGRSHKLRWRLSRHFGTADKTTVTQVRDGLVRSGVRTSIGAAVEFMRTHATIVYHGGELSGDMNTANRDIVEVSLFGRYRSPFNIKAEH